MRILLSAALLAFGISACSSATEKKDAEKPAAAKKLGIGDAAPALKANVWLKGTELKGYEPGKVYVLDFWATWCGPCISSMPHVDELARVYKEKGLVVVAVTGADDRGNTLVSVKEFIKTKADKFQFSFAFSDNDDTYDAFMTASGQNGIPCSFVIDQAGKIAFIGHPSELDDVLPEIFAGTWKGQASVDAIQKIQEEYDALIGRVETAVEKASKANEGKEEKVLDKAVRDAVAVAAASSLKDLPEFEKKYPNRTKKTMFVVQKIQMTMQARDMDTAKAISDAFFIASVAKNDKGSISFVARLWSSKGLNPDRKHVDLAAKAADELLRIDADGGISPLMVAAQAYYAAGQKEKAQAAGEKAIKLAGDNKKQKEGIEKALKTFME